MSANFPRSSNRTESTEDGGCIAGMLQCPICLRQLDDPRSLPCLHTYCRRCLAAQWPDRQPGERLSCPVCRALFDVPQSGLADLPHNFFLQQLIDERRPTCSSAKGQQQQHQQQQHQQQRAEFHEQQSSTCDVCSTSVVASFLPTFEREAVSRPAETIAIIYCSDCRLKLCGSCLRPHTGQTDSGSHRLQSLPLTNVADADVDVVPATTVIANLISEQQNCDKHPGRVVELYCFDCKTNVCLMCFAVDHRFHDCQQLNQVADSFRCRMETDEQTLLFRIVDFRKHHRRLETSRSRLVDGLLDVEDVIRRRADVLKRTLDSQVKDMMRQIQGVRVDSLKKFDSDRKAIDKTILALELHCRESKRVRIQGKPSDVTAAADPMHAKAQQLLLTSHRLMVDEFKPPKVVFLPGYADSGRRDETASRSDVECTFVLGNLTVIEPGAQEALADKASEHQELANDRILLYKKRPLALMSIKLNAASGEVTGLTQLEDFLYVVISKSSIVYVHSSTPPYHKLAAIHVDGLDDPSDIATCTLTKQLYIADNGVNSCCLWRLEPAVAVSEVNECVSTANNSECLAVERRPSSLSITSGRLLVTPHAGNRLFIHRTTDGQLLKQVRLSYYMEPYHSVESLRGTYFVSHGGHYDASIGQVSEVDDKGRTLRTYGEDAANTASNGRVDLSPFVRFSVDHLGNRLLLQDALSCQVVLLDATSLQFQTILVTKSSPISVDDATTRFNNVSLTSSSPLTNLKTSRMYLATESGLLFVSRGHQMDIFIVKRFKKHVTNNRRTSQLTANTLQVGDLTLRCDNTSVVS